VAEFDPAIVRSAIDVNQPTSIFLNHVDHVDIRTATASNMTPVAANFVSSVEELIGRGIDWVGTGPAALTSRAQTRIKDRRCTVVEAA
jgi:adenylosuccinate synthase